jgi:hypothetical protein
LASAVDGLANPAFDGNKWIRCSTAPVIDDLVEQTQINREFPVICSLSAATVAAVRPKPRLSVH